MKYCDNSNLFIASDRFLECNFTLPDAIALRSPLQPKLQDGQIITFATRLRRALCRATYPLFVRWSLRHLQIDIVHSHFAHTGWRYHHLAKSLDAKHVVSFYGWDYVRLGNSSTRWKHQLDKLFASADAFICEGPHGKGLLVGQGCPSEKVWVSRLGVDTHQIPFFQRTKTHDALRLLQIASFREKKGHIDTVSAFAIALSSCPNMHLTLTGASPGRVHDEVVALIQAYGIDNKVTLRPGVPFDQLHTVMQDYHVFIHPSRHASDGDCEGGAPVVLLDAEATGMPVVATTHCDIPQEVVDGATGFLCKEGDTEALAQAICKFYTMDQPTFDRFAIAARRYVEDNFEASTCATHLEEIYDEILHLRKAY